MYLNFIALDLSLNHLVILLGDTHKIFYKKKIIVKRDRAGLLFNSMQDVINDLKHGDIKHPMFSDYKKIGGDVYKRFVKYIYMYLTPENK